MSPGKSRTVRYRETARTRFDAALIDDFVSGPPNDPLERRAIRVVYGAPELTADLRGCIVTGQGPPELEETAMASPGVANVALVKGSDTKVSSPRHCTWPVGQPLLFPAQERPIAADHPTEPTTIESPRQAPVVRLSERTARWMATGGNRKKGPDENRFSWTRFLLSAAAGGSLGAAVVAVLRSL